MTGELSLDDERVIVTNTSGAGAVLASRAPTAPDDLDYFPTPPWAARAGGELIKAIDPTAKSCWEPACGGGHMAYGLRDYFQIVRSSDVFDHSESNPDQDRVVDFLSPHTEYLTSGAQQPDWIVTNPPFKIGEAFIRRAYGIAQRGVAMLLRLQFIEGGARHKLFTEDCPLTVLAPFSERVPMVKGRWDPEASSATAYAWFIFDKRRDWETSLDDWKARRPEPVVRLIAPGTRERLTMPGDLARFGLAETAALFDGEAA